MIEDIVKIAALFATIVGCGNIAASLFQKDEAKKFNLEVLGLLYMIFAKVMIHG